MNYSFLDQAVHRVAFGAPHLQLTLSELEDTLYARRFCDVECGPPIFVTSLPRAGTTVLLQALERLPRLASHRYTDMPFVYAPILWSALSASFRRAGEKSQRAHGDGIAIDVDSPEAFEEVFWMRFWPEKYNDDGIALWHNESGKAEFDTFFRNHMRKIVAMRWPDGGRYVSKNNANIARLDYLNARFPEAAVIVPFRDPIEHAQSLLRQHKNFCELHSREPFAKRYMRDIGHFEFGALHKPIRFDGFNELSSLFDPLRIEYWLAYWIAAFRQVIRHADDILLVPLEQARQRPRYHLQRICAFLQIDSGSEIESAAGSFSRDNRPPADTGQSQLASEARALHATLLQLSKQQ